MSLSAFLLSSHLPLTVSRPPFKELCIDYAGSMWMISPSQGPQPAKPRLPCEVTYSQLLGIRVRTLVGEGILSP